MRLFSKDKRVGSAENKRRYDLPLNKDEGTNFLRLLIALMSFLATMALAGSFALDGMSERWSSGLENKMTIEIPAEEKDGTLRGNDEIKRMQSEVENLLKTSPAVKTYDVMDQKDIQDLVEPWLGKNAPLDDIPLPGLVSVELNPEGHDSLSKLSDDMAVISPDIVMDTHQDWLSSLLRMTASLRFAALVVVIIIGVTTITAIAGAIRSRIAVHKADVELLHLMGANDEYIIRQFQRHALLIALQGSAGGTIAAIVALLGLHMATNDSGAALLPEFTLNALQTLSVVFLPVAACAIAALTARFTVLRSLSLMP